MKILAGIAIVLAVAYTGLVIFANMMKPAETGGFIGIGSVVFAWTLAAIFTAIAWS